ncbi:hypothetical protein SEA_CAMERICO_61 [Gordonia phage Camerico]|nr:hypothetical protein SEA_CAMERICO_61 [Gordonia phage Camerico]
MAEQMQVESIRLMRIRNTVPTNSLRTETKAVGLYAEAELYNAVNAANAYIIGQWIKKYGVDGLDNIKITTEFKEKFDPWVHEITVTMTDEEK